MSGEASALEARIATLTAIHSDGRALIGQAVVTPDEVETWLSAALGPLIKGERWTVLHAPAVHSAAEQPDETKRRLEDLVQGLLDVINDEQARLYGIAGSPSPRSKPFLSSGETVRVTETASIKKMWPLTVTFMTEIGRQFIDTPCRLSSMTFNNPKSDSFAFQQLPKTLSLDDGTRLLTVWEYEPRGAWIESFQSGLTVSAEIVCVDRENWSRTFELLLKNGETAGTKAEVLGLTATSRRGDIPSQQVERLKELRQAEQALAGWVSVVDGQIGLGRGAVIDQRPVAHPPDWALDFGEVWNRWQRRVLWIAEQLTEEIKQR